MCSARDRVGTPRKRSCSAPDRRAAACNVTSSPFKRSSTVAPWADYSRHRVATSVHGRASIGCGHCRIRTGRSESQRRLMRRPSDVAYILKGFAPIDVHLCSNKRRGQARTLEVRQLRDAAGSRAHALGQGGERVWPSRRCRRQPSSGNVSPRSCIVAGRECYARTGNRCARGDVRVRNRHDGRWLRRVRAAAGVNGLVHLQYAMRRSPDGVVTLVRRMKEVMRGHVHRGISDDPRRQRRAAYGSRVAPRP